MSIEQQYPNRPRNGKIFAGLILLCVGGVLLLQQLSWFIFPDWVLSFPMFLIALGVYIGAKSDFKKPGGIILIAFGAILLADRIVPSINLDRIIWPLMIIGFGFWMIMGRKNSHGRNRFDRFNGGNTFDNPTYSSPLEGKPGSFYDPNAATGNPINPDTGSSAGSSTNVPPYNTGDQWLDTISVFGGVKRTILSKDFKGGEIVNVFGGTDLDLTQADINGRVVIDVTQLFGGIKLIVPPHWQVVSDLAAVFSSVDDKRRSMGTPLSPDKILVIKGVSIFAGVDVRSY